MSTVLVTMNWVSCVLYHQGLLLCLYIIEKHILIGNKETCIK